VTDSAPASDCADPISSLDRVLRQDPIDGAHRAMADTNQSPDSHQVPPTLGSALAQGHVSSSGCTEAIAPREGTALPRSSAVETGYQHGMLTQAQHGISKPKLNIDGMIRYSLLTTVGESTYVQEALGDPNWEKAMNSEFATLQINKTWHLVPPKKNVNVVDCK
jgi:hypothetical protein